MSLQFNRHDVPGSIWRCKIPIWILVLIQIIFVLFIYLIPEV